MIQDEIDSEVTTSYGETNDLSSVVKLQQYQGKELKTKQILVNIS